MKLLKSSLLLLIITLVTFIGCKKDPSSPSNHIKYKGVEYPMDKAVMVMYDEIDEGIYDVEFVLLSPEFTLHYSGGEIDSLSGVGNGIAFEMITGISNGLDNGKYTWGSEDNPVPYTLLWADAVFDFDGYEGEGTEIEATDGELIVADNQTDYEISFSTRMEDGETITGFYKGNVMKFDDFKKKSSKKKQLFQWHNF